MLKINKKIRLKMTKRAGKKRIKDNKKIKFYGKNKNKI